MRKFEECFINNKKILMEGALAERVKREYSISIDNDVALASMIYSENKRIVLKKLFSEYIEIARRYSIPIIITTPTRRANKFRVYNSQYDENIMADNVDFLYAGIMPTIDEAIGMAKAMEQTGLPYIISFMTNCVHPDIVNEAMAKEFNKTEFVKNRFKGIQANAANLSPEDLDNSYELVASNPVDLAESIVKLYDNYSFKIFGGCCGTDDKYLNEIAKRIVQC